MKRSRKLKKGKIVKYVDANLKTADDEDAVEEGKPVTFLKAFRRALISDPVQAQLSPAQKEKRYDLFVKLPKPEKGVVEFELTSDEITTIKEAVNIYPTIIFGQLVRFLDQKS